MKGKPIETDIGCIQPSLLGDKTTTGEAITAGSLYMTMNGGTATLTHAGEKVKIAFRSILPTGALLIESPTGRQFVLSIEKVINHAIDSGLLDDQLKFEPLA